MKIETNKVVGIHYTLTLESGELVDTTKDAEPLLYLAGSQQIIPGLESELMGCSVGDNKKVVIQPEDGYGEYDETLVQKLPREMFTGIDQIEVGMEFQTQSPSGDAQYVIVTQVSDEEITIDGNPEFAGKVLHFDVTVDSIRDAEPEEIDHGHVH